MMLKYITVFVLLTGMSVESKSIYGFKANDVLSEYYSSICKISGNEDKTEALLAAARSSFECALELTRPLDNDTLHGTDDFFKKACDNIPRWKECLMIGESAIKPCLDTVYLYGATDDYVDQTINFYCNVDGKNFAEFLSTYTTGGAECFLENYNDAKRECPKLVSNNEAKNFTDRERCAKFDEFVSCQVKVLKDCAPTIGNAAEQRFRYLRNSTACKKDNKTETKNVLSKSSKSPNTIQDVTSAHFSKIIERELSEMPKKKRINCMKGMLEVLEAHII